jgi:hypothetical protein
MSSTSRRGDYQEDDYMEDGYDRQGERYGRSDSGRDQYDYEGDDRGARGAGGAKRGLGRRDMDGEREYYRSGDYRGPDLRGDDSMERFRQGKDVKKKDLYGFETANTPSSKKRIQRPRGGRESGNKRPRSGENMRGGGTANGGYNAPSRGGGRRDGSAGRDRGMSLDDLNEML